METSPGQSVRLRALQARSSLNGTHGVVIAAASSSEAAELELKKRVKVRTALTEEILSVRHANVEPTEWHDAAFSTTDFAVVRSPGRGFIWQAKRNLRSGKVLFREDPLLVFRMEDHLADPVIQALQESLAPHLDSSTRYSPEAMALFQKSAERIAEREYARFSTTQQRHFMALHDAFSVPPTKSVGGIYRTNAFAREDTEGAVMYNVLSRVNHSCVPNVAKHYEGFTAVVCTVREVAKGEELSLSYLGADVDKPSSERRELLLGKYNFECCCTLCVPQ